MNKSIGLYENVNSASIYTFLHRCLLNEKILGNRNDQNKTNLISLPKYAPAGITSGIEPVGASTLTSNGEGD